jgi:hypothetical protein
MSAYYIRTVFFNIADAIYQGVTTSFGHVINYISFNGPFNTSSAVLGWDNNNSSFNVFIRNGAALAMYVLNSGLATFNLTGATTINYNTMELIGTSYTLAGDTVIINSAGAMTILPGGSSSTPGYVLTINPDGTTCSWQPLP